MAHPDSDQVIGRLAGARLGRMTAPAGELCPEPEELAAYVDGGLAPDEAARLEIHLAGCASCRRLLAALVPEPAAGIAAEPAVRSGVVLPFPQRRIVVWMSAAAALLVAVTLWSVSRLSEPASTRMASAPAEQAPGEPRAADAPLAPAAPSAGGSARAATPAPEDEAPPAAMPVSKVAEPRASVDEQKPSAAARDRAGAGQASAREAKRLADATASALEERVAQGQRQIPAQTNTAAAGVSRPRGPLAQQASNAAQNVQNVPPVAAPPPPAPAAAPSPPPPAAEAAARRETVVTGAEAAGRADAAADGRLAKAEPVVGLARSKETDAALGGRAAFSIAGASAVPSFAEPEGRLQWRIAGGTRLESSSDGGTSWRERHRSRVRLRAGSAPAIDAAWAVGDGGLVLRFTVPGEWAAVTRPAEVTLIDVSASSATAARVVAADGRVFETTDAGRTWQPAGAGAPPR
jgi:hypothetical protein